MRTKNSILYKTSGGQIFSGNGLQRKAMHHNLRETMHHQKAESSVNNAVFGKVLGVKKDNDSTKIGTIGSGNEPRHLPSSQRDGGPSDDIKETLQKISFKEKKAKNNISLKI
jgi:hypothetical protein